jgi:hypothetical protein
MCNCFLQTLPVHLGFKHTFNSLNTCPTLYQYFKVLPNIIERYVDCLKCVFQTGAQIECEENVDSVITPLRLLKAMSLVQAELRLLIDC